MSLIATTALVGRLPETAAGRRGGFAARLLVASFALHAALLAALSSLHAPPRLVEQAQPSLEMLFEPAPPSAVIAREAATIPLPDTQAPEPPLPQMAEAPALAETAPIAAAPMASPSPLAAPAAQSADAEPAAAAPAAPAPAPTAALAAPSDTAPLPPLAPVRPPPRRVASAPPHHPVPPASHPSTAPTSHVAASQAASMPMSNAPISAPITAPPAAATTAPAQPVISSAWRGALAAWIGSRRHYPEDARRLGQEGGVVVKFTVKRDGAVLDQQLVRTSGSPSLDLAALAMFRDARLPPFPAEMAQPQVTVTVPVRYRLEE